MKQRKDTRIYRVDLGAKLGKALRMAAARRDVSPRDLLRKIVEKDPEIRGELPNEGEG